jgi:hypothetical protein
VGEAEKVMVPLYDANVVGMILDVVAVVVFVVVLWAWTPIIINRKVIKICILSSNTTL